MLVLFAVLAGFIAWNSFHLELRYYDELEYLTNARALAGFGTDFSDIRRNFVTWFYVPLARFSGLDFGRLFHGAGIEAAILGFVCAGLFWLAMRRSVEKRAANVAALLLFLNPLFIHNSHLVGTDVPALGLTALLLITLQFVVEKPNRATILLLALTLGLSTFCRGNLVVSYAIFGISGLALTLGGSRKTGIALILAVLGGCLVEWALSFSTYALIHGGISEGIRIHFHTLFRDVWFTTKTFPHLETPLNRPYLRYLGESVTWPLLAVAAWGGFAGFKRNRTLTILLTVFLIAHVMVLESLESPNEARYLLAFLPVVYFFIAQAVERLPKKRAIAAVLALLFLQPAIQAWQAFNYFRQPFFRQPFVREIVADLQSNVSPAARLYWSNDFYPMAPAHPRGDWGIFADVIHLSPRMFSNYLNQRVDWLPPGKLTETGSGLKDGDLILDSQAQFLHLANLPEKPLPFFVHQVVQKAGKTELQTRVFYPIR